MVHIEVEIEGVADPAIVHAIRERVREVGRRFGRSGDCQVWLAPSEVRGEWDLGIRGATRWDLVSSTTPVDRLPEFVERTLCERGRLERAEISKK